MKLKKITSMLTVAALAAGLVTLPAVNAAAVTYTVGAGKDYATIRAAVAAAKAAAPKSEGDRITINVDPGDYEEQVVLDDLHFVTLQQTPGTSGRVDLHWYYCTGYCSADCGLDGEYDPNLDWYANPPRDGNGKEYKLGESIPKNTVLTYKKKDGTTETKTLTRDSYYLGTTGGLSQMAALQVRNKTSDVTVKDFNIVNSIPVMVTQGEKNAHVTPEHDRAIDVAASYPLMYRDGLSLCDETTALTKPSGDYYDPKGIVDGKKVYNYVKNGGTFTAEESAWLVQSLAYNERGHAVSTTNCDRIIFDGIRLRGNQDSLFASGDRLYFRNCDIIGGTDYIYGNAAAVFDSCKLGLAGSTDRVYGSPIAVPNTDAKRSYGYLFFNCTTYNTRDNNGTHNFGGPWGAAGQVTYYNTKIDDNATVGKSAFVLDPLGWHRFSAEQGLGRLYEYGTTNLSGAAVDLSKRVVNKSVEEGGYGMGTVLDKWQILEFNPRNYFSGENAGKSDDWDPMGFGQTYLAQADSEIAASTITVPAGEETVVDLPTPSDNNIEFHWVSDSTNAVVSADDKKLTVVRPAAGEDAITTSVTLYARDKSTGFGDMKEIPVTINPTTDTSNVFSIPVTIEQSLAAKNKYTVTISKEGALIKQQEINLQAGESSASATIENIPASAAGIDYDVTIVSESNDFTVTAPVDGKTTVKGITGNNVELALKATKLIDKEITLDASATAAVGNKTFDLIALAKAKGATDDIASSDVISVTFDVDITSALSKAAYIDISSGTPVGNNRAEPARFTEFKLNSSWTQIDSVDCTQGFSGSSSGDHQCLNVTGKFDYSTKHTLTATIDYKNGTVTIDGNEAGQRKTATPWTFAAFPENAEKGTFNMGVFPGSTSDSFTVSNIRVTYKKVATAEDVEDPEPELKDKKYDFLPANNEYINTTNSSSSDPRGSVDGNDYDLEGNGSVVISKDNYHSGTGHGLVIWGGDNKIKIKADGPMEITVGGCAYSAANNVTLKANGTAVDTQSYAKAEGETNVLKYNGTEPAELTVVFDGYVYLHSLEIKNVDPSAEPTAEPTPEPTPTPEPQFAYAADKAYNLAPKDNEYINSSNSSASEPRGSVDGNAYYLNGDKSVVFSKDCYQSGTNHGVVVWGGENKITIQAAGPMEVTVGGCTYSAANNVTLKANGTVVDTQTYAKQDGETNVLKYDGTEPAELTVVFDGYVYLHSLEIKNVDPSAEPTAEPTPEPTEAPEKSDRAYIFDTVFNPAEHENVMLRVAASKDGVQKKGETDLYDQLKNYDGDMCIAVIISDVSDDIKIDSAVIEIDGPTSAPIPTDKPTEDPTTAPTEKPTAAPTEKPTTAPTAEPTTAPADGSTFVDFTAMSKAAAYTAAAGQGFVEYSSAIMPEGSARQAAPVSGITVSSEGAKVTESGAAYTYAKANSNDGDDYNYGGMIYRIDKPAGAYHIEVEVTGSAADTRVAPTGMDASRLTGSGNWDNCGNVPRRVSAKWSGSKWSYDFATGEDFIEIEIEPSGLATAAAPETVGVKSIKITPIAPGAAGAKPTIHIIGDSTQKTYSFNETISSWGQTLGNYFDKDKVNVINYSMGGRAMKSNYNEGRFNEILINGKAGDFVFLHSAHNDETISTNRFSRGSGSVSGDLTANNKVYNEWLDMYVSAIKARGMIPVLVTAMPRINSATGAYSESAAKPNGFNPDSPGNMRAKAAADSGVGLVELYGGAKAYLSKLDGKEVAYIYNMIEAGETPAANAANGANGDGTHYREAAAKQFCRIMLQSIYDQANAAADTYTDKAIMSELTSYMNGNVRTAAQSGNWSAVFPEAAKDVSAVDVIPGATAQGVNNFYYRTSIEKALQLGLLHKDADNSFKPTQAVTVGEFARGAEKAFGLSNGALANYEMTAAEIAAAGISPASAAAGSAGANGTVTTASTGTDTVAVNVTQPTGGTITVYNESAFNTQTVDIKSGIAANDTVSDNKYFTLIAPPEVKDGADSGGVFADNPDITTAYVDFRNTNPDKHLTYTAKADGILTVYARFQGSKPIELAGTTTQTKYVDSDTSVAGTTDWAYGTVTFNVEAGKTYTLQARGGTGRLFGVKYESTEYPQSTTQLNVKKGDRIRLAVVPAANYVIGGITNGTETTSNREYTFTAAENVSISVALENEPAMVGTTIVASDAALTRAVMGAILYDAYQLADKTNIAKYMAQNGGVPSPDDPNYDPNIQYEGSPYIPVTGWGALTDKDGLDPALFAKVKAAYNLGLIRPETGIARGSIALGTELEPTAVVTRAKAAKSLVFAFILTQPQNGESQTVPAGYGCLTPSEIAEPAAGVSQTVYTR